MHIMLQSERLAAFFIILDASCKNIDLLKGKPFSIFFYRYRYQLLTLKNILQLLFGGFCLWTFQFGRTFGYTNALRSQLFSKGGKEVSMYGIGPVCPWLSSQDTVGLQILALNHIWCKIYSSLKLHTYLVLTVMVFFQVYQVTIINIIPKKFYTCRVKNC